MSTLAQKSVHLEGFDGAVDVECLLALEAEFGGGFGSVLRPLLLSASRFTGAVSVSNSLPYIHAQLHSKAWGSIPSPDFRQCCRQPRELLPQKQDDRPDMGKQEPSLIDDAPLLMAILLAVPPPPRQPQVHVAAAAVLALGAPSPNCTPVFVPAAGFAEGAQFITL